jgi:two-component system, cell cycle sensor histidine kinase and response regulator CckA
MIPTEAAKEGRLTAGFRQRPGEALVFGAVMPTDTTKKTRPVSLKHYGWILIVVWTLVAAGSLGWNLYQDQGEALRVARNIALTNYERDVLYRRWAAAHGGVYVPVTPRTPPTPYLGQVPERDIVTPSGRRLTLLNPAYMTRQIYELAQESGLPRGHLTSLKPLRPQNAPDAWEKQALESFEQGKAEVSEVVSIDGQPFMRLMRPFRIDPSCLHCHEEQGYKVGDIRGGISVTVSMEPIMRNALHTWSLILGHVILWMFGVAGIVLAGRRVSLSTAAALQAQETAAAATMAVQTVDGMLDGVIITDLRGRITHTNKALTEYFGWGQEALGELATKLIVERDAAKILTGLAACLEQGYARDLECDLLTKDRREVPALINASLITGPQGGPLGVIWAIRDITALRRAEMALEAERRRLLSLLEELPAYVYLKAPDYSIKFANRFFREKIGDPGNRRCYEVLHGFTAPCQACQAMQVLAAHQPQEREWVHRGGRTYHAYVYPFADSDGSPLVLELGIDITEWKRAEEEVHQLNEELEQRVRSRTAQLEAANQELESFSYSVSHDLRGPLRAIDGFSRILLKDYANRLDVEGQRLLEVIRANTRDMGQLIDDLLAFSRLGRREVQAADLDMGALVRNVVRELQDTLGDRTVQWDLKPLPGSRADQALIRQVWVNLLDNALKFTRPRESACIEVGCRSTADEEVYYVKDNGVGFDIQYAPKLFGVFQRLHRYEEFEGTGVGLALVQRIVQRHGGRVWAEGQIDGGATFYFSLPRRQAEPAAS